MSKYCSVFVGPATLCLALCANAPEAHAEVPDTPAWNANVGFVSGLGIALLLSDDGAAGGGLELSGRYGMPAGVVVLAPGARLGGYYLDEQFIGMLMPTFRVTLPLGPLAPFVHGGAGGGVLTNPGNAGLAWLAGGGLMIHFGDVLSLGAEVNYEGITGTSFRVLSIGPTLIIGS